MQEGITGEIELHEDKEIHVRAMIGYLYNLNYTEAEGNPPDTCTHANDEAHVFDDPECILWPFGLSVAMHVLADKYGIEHLAQDASTRLKHLLGISKNSWGDDLRVVKHAYHQSRHNDRMRKVITGYVITRVNKPLQGEEVGVR